MDANIEKLAQDVREELITLLKNTLSLAQDDLFPNADQELTDSLKSIEQETFDVVVCGEVKKGKSSFINAIIGDKILPVDTKVATSQAFRIVNADERAYFLVHTDGTRKSITKEELETYGSQAKIDEAGENIEFDKIVDFIEVHTPIEFLPKSVVLVDTPGIGAIYANHATITERHLANASAVIFVMDPANPLTTPEVSFIHKIETITPNILFVMTKQDNYDNDYIVNMIYRNEEILVKEQFDKVFGAKAIRILPVSSELLSIAGSSDQESKKVLYEASCFNEVKSELNKLLLTTIALSRNIIAYNNLIAYNTKVMQLISDGQKVLTSPADDSKNLILRKQHVKSDFKTKWGPTGKEQKNIIEKVNGILTAFTTRSNALFAPGSELYNKIVDEIEALEKLDSAKSYAQSFPQRLSTEYIQAWKKLNEECTSAIVVLLSKYHSEMKTNSIEAMTDAGNLTLSTYSVPTFGVMDHFNFCKNGWFSIFFVTSAMGIAALPTLVILPIAAFLGWITGQNHLTLKIKNELKIYLNSNLHSLREQVLNSSVDPKDPMAPSRIKAANEHYLKLAQDTLEEIYNDQLAKADEEITRITEQITQAAAHRVEIEKQIKKVEEKWKPVHKKLCDINKNLSSLDNILQNKN